MLFTFRRDAEGRETIHVGDVAIARIRHDLPAECDDIEWLASPPAGVTAEHVREAAVKADEAGFWKSSLVIKADHPLTRTVRDFASNETACDVPVAETTSTIMSLTTEEEQ